MCQYPCPSDILLGVLHVLDVPALDAQWLAIDVRLFAETQ